MQVSWKYFTLLMDDFDGMGLPASLAACNLCHLAAQILHRGWPIAPPCTRPVDQVNYASLVLKGFWRKLTFLSRVDFKLSEKVQYQVYKDGLRRQQRAPVHHAQCHRCQRDRQGYTLPLLYFFQPFPLDIENCRN